MITKETLIKAAKQAQKENKNVYLVNDNVLKIIIDDNMFSSDFLNKYNYDYNKNLIQAFLPDQILKYDTAYYDKGTMSLDTFLEKVNKQYKEV